MQIDRNRETSNARMDVSRLLWILILTSPVNPHKSTFRMRFRPNHSSRNAVSRSSPSITCSIQNPHESLTIYSSTTYIAILSYLSDSHLSQDHTRQV
jgi:hypothetical protein